MTREKLEKYHDIAVRLKLLTSAIVTDTVTGSSDEYPFTCHPISIHGLRKDDKARREIEILTRQKSEIDRFIDDLEDVRAKTLLDMHYRKGWNWCKVAHETGKSMEANKQFLRRFWKCTLLSPYDPL